jgi:hypothetical protein
VTYNGTIKSLNKGYELHLTNKIKEKLKFAIYCTCCKRQLVREEHSKIEIITKVSEYCNLIVLIKDFPGFLEREKWLLAWWRANILFL